MLFDNIFTVDVSKKLCTRMDYCEDFMDCGLTTDEVEYTKDDLSDMTVFMSNYPKDALRQMMMMRSNRKLSV